MLYIVGFFFWHKWWILKIASYLIDLYSYIIHANHHESRWVTCTSNSWTHFNIFGETLNVMNVAQMSVDATAIIESLMADFANKWSFSSVNSHVFVKISFTNTHLSTQGTRPHSLMTGVMRTCCTRTCQGIICRRAKRDVSPKKKKKTKHCTLG